MKVRTRFAPSPTGYLHVGGLRTALYAYYVARQNNGDFLLRIEDTDQERLVPGAIEALVRAFNRMHLDYDEGPMFANEKLVEKGAYGPYVQSARLDLYKKYTKELVASGHAYECFCSKEWLDTLRAEQAAAKLPMGHIGSCDPRATKQTEPVIRFRMSREGSTEASDLIRGIIRFPNQDQEDFVLLKTDGFSTYHLASVVDDHLMEISHVTRTEEWLSSVPKHLQLYAAFGWTAPVFAHLPLVLNPDRTKLSKRKGDVAVEDYLAKGYLPEALENFMALIGYNPTGDREIYSREEMVRLFDLSKVNKAGGVFDIAKLNWMNEQYLRKISVEELTTLVAPFLKEAKKDVPAEILKKICAVEQGRMTVLKDIVDRVEGYLATPVYDPALLVWKKADATDAKRNLEALVALFSSETNAIFDSIAVVEECVLRYIKEKELKNGNVLWPMRVALSGRAASPSPFELAWIFGKDETLRRLHAAVKSL